jgi:predicted TIM-barrel fold metal-dependent hydrolase
MCEIMPEIKAIDMHVHLHDALAIEAKGERSAQMARYMKRKDDHAVSVDELADQYRARQMMAVLVNTTDISTSGTTPVPNDHIAAAVRKHPDVFIGFGAIDPWQGKVAKDEIKRCAEVLGLKGIGELHGARQHFAANKRRFYPLWEEVAKHKLPIMFHTGMLAGGAGTRGGMGFKLKYNRPIPILDDVAADFPELTIIGAHPSWPWAEETLAVCRHKANYYIDLSGWAPKYWPPSVAQQANSLLQDRVLFGSDWPQIQPERWMEEFEQLPFKPEVRQKILLDNARRLLNLT